jgi:hypothetical protein
MKDAIFIRSVGRCSLRATARIGQRLLSRGETHVARWHEAGRAEAAPFIIPAKGQ